MKKALVLMLALMMVVCVFAGCSGGSKATATPAATAEATAAPSAEASAAPAPAAKSIIFATTTSVQDSGLLAYLQPFLLEDTGITMDVVAQGTGKAIQTAKDGNAGAILVHAKASEEEMITEGFGTERVTFMYNYFVIVGPAADPAGIKDCKTAEEAFTKIKDSGSKFVSRGDDSGTHKAELKIWKAAGVETPAGDWYVSAGQGMGATLTMANEQLAYCMTDKATYLSMKAELDGLGILLEKTDALLNEYSFVRLNPEKLTNVDAALQDELIAWFTSEKTLDLIDAYGVDLYGEQLFYTYRDKAAA